jgi:hypothetical protein
MDDHDLLRSVEHVKEDHHAEGAVGGPCHSSAAF